MGTIYKPLSANGLLKPAGQCGFQLLGQAGYTQFGHATLSWKKSSTKSEIRTPEDPGRPIIATDYSEQSGMVDIEFSNLNKLGMGLAFMANQRPYTQDAVASKTQTFRGAMLQEILELKGGANVVEEAAHAGLINTVVTSVEIGGEVVSPLTYRHDSKSGTIQITSWPEGAEANEDVEVTFTAPAVTAAASVSAYDLLSSLFFRGRFMMRQNNLRGVNRKLIIPQLAFGGDGGDVQMIQDGNDVVKISVSGTIEADYSQPTGRENGYLVDLVDSAA